MSFAVFLYKIGWTACHLMRVYQQQQQQHNTPHTISQYGYEMNIIWLDASRKYRIFIHMDVFECIYMRHLVGDFFLVGAACRNMYRKCSTTQKRMEAACFFTGTRDCCYECLTCVSHTRVKCWHAIRQPHRTRSSMLQSRAEFFFLLAFEIFAKNGAGN